MESVSRWYRFGMLGGLAAFILLVLINWSAYAFGWAVVGPHELYGLVFWVSLIAMFIAWGFYWSWVTERDGWRDYPRQQSTAEKKAFQQRWAANQWIRDWEAEHTPSRRNQRTKYKRDYAHWTEVAYRDGRNCYLCGTPVNPNDFTRNRGGWLQAGPTYPSVDHVIPRSRGGWDDLSNLKLAHHRCNTLKRDT